MIVIAYTNQKIVLRSFPSVAQYYCLRWLYTDPVPMSITQQWMTISASKTHQETIKLLREWHVLFESSSGEVGLHPVFKIYLGYAINGNVNRSLDEIMGEETISVSQLEQYALDTWYSILHFMVGTSHETYRIGHHVVSLLLEVSLMA
jgi:hypothetical protein